MKIRPVGAKFHVNGRTGMTKLIVAFSHLRTGLKSSGKMCLRLEYVISISVFL